MHNIKLCIEYDGTNFYGWETQPQKRTVRGEITSALSKILGEKVKLVSGARTDRGVHALNQIANFKTKSSAESLPKIVTALRKLLPRDIFIKNATFVDMSFDSRRDAKSRGYLYKLLMGRAPLLKNYVWEYPYKLNIEKMKEAIPLFMGVHHFDFFSFKDSGECCIKDFKIWEDEYGENNSQVIFEIESDRFLHKMVRMIVGTLTEIGRGRNLNISAMLSQKGEKGFCAPPQGLYLKEIKY